MLPLDGPDVCPSPIESFFPGTMHLILAPARCESPHHPSSISPISNTIQNPSLSSFHRAPLSLGSTQGLWNRDREEASQRHVRATNGKTKRDDRSSLSAPKRKL